MYSNTLARRHRPWAAIVHILMVTSTPITPLIECADHRVWCLQPLDRFSSQLKKKADYDPKVRCTRNSHADTIVTVPLAHLYARAANTWALSYLFHTHVNPVRY